MSMSQDPSEFSAPVSAFVGPVGELIAQRMLAPPTRPGLLAVVDHFEILRVLGGGGMGIVLLARDSRNGRDAAVKLVKSGLVMNQEVVHRFLKEAGHLKKLRHTNIVPVDEISEKPEAPYFVMPYFEKGSLANRIKPGQPLDTQTNLDIATQVAEGLSFAHRSGIIHRDLKPANILVNSNGTVCLADFGLARSLFNDTIVDVEGRQLEGTAPYMSPAVAAGDAEDTRCDIYSFGALLYEMLTGQPPYKGQSTKEILNKIIAGPPKPITSLNPAADRRLVTVAEQAMARELRDRYADMRDILKDLHQIKDGKDPVNLNKRTLKEQIEFSLGKMPTLQVSKVTLVIWILICLALGLLAWIVPRIHKSPVATAPPPVATQPATPPPVEPTASAPASAAPVISTFAGIPGTRGYTNGPAAKAEFHLPNNVAVDHSGNVYVADTANDVIRKITPNGMVTTLAGMARDRGSADGKGAKARFWAPFGIAVDAAGMVYVADTANNTIRKITPDGTVSTLAGLAAHPGTNDGNGSKARFRNPWSVAVDNTDGDVFVADMSNNAIRRVSPAGDVYTFAGHPGMAGSADGFGNDARFDNPFAVAVDGAGDVYVSDSANNAIRKITHRVVTTLAGSPGNAGNTDGQGANARFWNPQGLAVDSAGDVYVADTGNNLIRKITPMGVVTTISEAPPDDATDSAGDILNSPGGVAVDDSGNIYIADSNDHCIREIKTGK